MLLLIFICIFALVKRLLLLLTIVLISGLISSVKADSKVPIAHPVVFVANWNQPPFSFIDKTDGKPKGFCVDIITTAFKRLHIPYIIKVESWKRSQEDMASGKADLSFMFFTPSLTHKYTFGMNIKQIPFYIVCRKDDKTIKGMQSLNGRKVIVNDETCLNDLLKGYDIKCDLIHSTNAARDLMLLSRGKYDAYFTNKLTAEYLIDRYQLKDLELRQTNIIPQENKLVGTNKELVSTVSSELFKMTLDGTFTDMSQHWFYIYQGIHIPMAVYIILAALLVIAITAIVTVRILRRRVKNADESILDKNLQMLTALRTGKVCVWNFKLNDHKFYNVGYEHSAWNEVTMHNISEIIHKDDQKMFLDYLSDVSKGIKHEKSIIIRLDFNHSGTWHYKEINMCARYNSDKIITNVIGAQKDVTDRMRYQKALVVEKNKAQESNRLKSEFLANMSHEIRTPLNAIVGFSDVITGNMANGNELEECKNLIHKNSLLLLGLINDILDLSRIESGEMAVINSEFDITETIRYLYLSLKEIHGNKKNIDFRMYTPYDKCIIKSDKKHITQILTNFLTNAFKYTEQGFIHVGYEIVDEGIQLFVEDSGIGIPNEKRNKVFDRFDKIGSLKQGAGLGLTICKAIADRMNGRIGVESEIGTGSTFWVWLPVIINRERDLFEEQ